MKVALFEKPQHFGIATKPLRSLEDGEVLVRVSACGICGTDVHIVDGASRSSPPVVLGHEYAGHVEDSKAGGRRFKSGDHLAVDPNIACGTCSYCRRGLVHLCTDLRALGVDIDGGMGEYCIVPESQIYELPMDMPADKTAFIEPLSCAVHGIDRADIQPGDSVAILGSGTVGLLMLQLARIAGAAQTIVVEPNNLKREIAVKLGADVVIDPLAVDPHTVVMDLTHVGADVVIECVGKPQTMESALRLARRGATVEFFGVCRIGEKISVEPNQVYFKELKIVGSYVNPNTFSRAIALLQHGKVRIDDFLIHHFPLDGALDALRFQREGLTIKSIINPGA